MEAGLINEPAVGDTREKMGKRLYGLSSFREWRLRALKRKASVRRMYIRPTTHSASFSPTIDDISTHLMLNATVRRRRGNDLK